MEGSSCLEEHTSGCSVVVGVHAWKHRAKDKWRSKRSPVFGGIYFCHLRNCPNCSPSPPPTPWSEVEQSVLSPAPISCAGLILGELLSPLSFRGLSYTVVNNNNCLSGLRKDRQGGIREYSSLSTQISLCLSMGNALLGPDHRCCSPLIQRMGHRGSNFVFCLPDLISDTLAKD